MALESAMKYLATAGVAAEIVVVVAVVVFLVHSILGRH